MPVWLTPGDNVAENIEEHDIDYEANRDKWYCSTCEEDHSPMDQHETRERTFVLTYIADGMIKHTLTSTGPGEFPRMKLLQCVVTLLDNFGAELALHAMEELNKTGEYLAPNLEGELSVYLHEAESMPWDAVCKYDHATGTWSRDRPDSLTPKDRLSNSSPQLSVHSPRE